MKIPPTRIPVAAAPRQLIRRLIVEEALHTSPPPVEIKDALIDAGSLLRLAPFTPLIAEWETDDSFYILVDGITRNWHWYADGEQTTSFACRGTQLRLSGEPANVAAASRAVEGMLLLIENHTPLEDQTVRYCISLAHDGAEKRVKELTEDFVTVTV